MDQRQQQEEEDRDRQLTNRRRILLVCAVMAFTFALFASDQAAETDEATGTSGRATSATSAAAI
jgi:hypothetical protein